MLPVTDTLTKNLQRVACVKYVHFHLQKQTFSVCPYFPSKLSVIIQRRTILISNTLTADKEELLMKIDKLELVQVVAPRVTCSRFEA